LRLYIDKPGGIKIDNCERVSKRIDPILDSSNIVRGHYLLEVSSPGLNRPLKKEEDFIKYSGRNVKIKTSEYFSGRRNFTGELLGCAEGKVMVKVAGEEVFAVPLSSILKANLEIELNQW